MIPNHSHECNHLRRIRDVFLYSKRTASISQDLPRSDQWKASRAVKKSAFNFFCHCDSKPEFNVDPTFYGNHLLLFTISGHFSTTHSPCCKNHSGWSRLQKSQLMPRRQNHSIGCTQRLIIIHIFRSEQADLSAAAASFVEGLALLAWGCH